MYGTGWAPKTKRWKLIIGYVVPTVNVQDWMSLKNETVTFDYENGERVSYGGVNFIEVGNTRVDGETEQKKAITLMASSRNGDFGA